MLTVVPFKAIVPRADIVETVSSENFDSQNKILSIEEMKRNPISYLHVAKPHLGFLEEKKNVAKHFPIALNKLNEFLDQGIMQRETAGVYIYRQIKDGRIYQGVIAGVHANDYAEERIKKHEFTRTDKEEEMVGQMSITHTIGTAVLVTYHQTHNIEELTKLEMGEKPMFDFVQKAVRHSVWKVREHSELCQLLSNLDDVYIADGHHRSASLVRYANKQKKANPKHNGTEAYNFLQTYFVPSTYLYVYEYNRLVANITETPFKILKHICDHFEVERKRKEAYQPKKMHNFGMYYQGQWYKLKAKAEVINDADPLESLDVKLLENYILKPVLKIVDSKTDERLSFVDGSKGLVFLQDRVDKKKADIAFTMYPTDIEQVMAVADIHATMPPKSTWIEPKMRTGFIVQDLNE